MDYEQPQEQEPQEDYSGMANMVRQQSMAPNGFDQMTEAQQNVSMGV